MGEDVPLVSPFVLEYAYKRSLGPVFSRFYTGLRAGRLEGVRTASGRVLFPPQEYDPRSGEAIQGWVQVGPAGTVVSFTETDACVWALVRLDGADSAMLHRVQAESVHVGMRVEVQWAAERVGGLEDIRAFVPEGSAVSVPVGAHSAEAEPVTGFKSPSRLDYLVTAGSVTADFLRGILDRRLIAKACPRCEKVYLPPRGSCPTCGVPTTRAVEIGERGTVTTFSVIRIPFEGQILEPPYACAHILMDGTDTPLLHIVGDCDVDSVRMGMRVEAVWAEELKPTFASVRFFRPTDEPDVPYDQLREHL